MSCIAAQAFYFLDTDYVQLRSGDDYYGVPYFWLVSGDQLIDPTAAQYEEFPYHAGMPYTCGAACTSIDTRTLLLMHKVPRFDGKPIFKSKLPHLFW